MSRRHLNITIIANILVLTTTACATNGGQSQPPAVYQTEQVEFEPGEFYESYGDFYQVFMYPDY